MEHAGRTGALGHGTTIREALGIPALRVGVPEVVAGRESLDREIRWVHAGEFTEMASVLKGGELLLTTGMGVPKGELGARRWLANLDTCGIAGLVIELGSALDAIPSALLSEARTRRLPLVALHRQVAFVEVTEVLHRDILSRREALLERGAQTYQLLSDLVTAGARTAEVVEALADLVGEPVVLARAGGGILFQANLDQPAADVATEWESMRRGLDDAASGLTLPVRLGRDAHWADLTAIPFNGDLDALQRAVMEHAVPFVALALMREREVSVLEARGRAEFLVGLTEGQQLNELHAATQAAALGFDHRADRVLPVVLSHRGPGARLREDQWVRLADGVCARIRAAGTSAIAGVQGLREGALLVVGLSDGQERAAAAGAVVEATREVARALSLDTDPLCVSVGRAATGWADVGAALGDTLAAAEAAPYRPARGWHDVASPDVAELLTLFRSSPVLRRLVQQRIDPLVEHDRRHRSSLVKTLEALFAHGGRKAEAARALFLERQSLYKRLARIETVLGIDLEDEETRLALHLALRARAVLDDVGSTR